MNEVTGAIVDAAMEVHTCLGPGLLESTYESRLCHELISRGYAVVRQLELPVIYKDTVVDAGYRLDLMVEDLVIVELKSVERVLPLHEVQLLSYLKLSNTRVGLLINFNVTRLKHGIKRSAN